MQAFENIFSCNHIESPASDLKRQLVSKSEKGKLENLKSFKAVAWHTEKVKMCK